MLPCLYILSTKQISILTVITIVIIGFGTTVLLSTPDPKKKNKDLTTEHEERRQNEQPQDTSRDTNKFSATNLKLPFNISDIDEQNGEVNPLGVVRFNKDRPEYGHSGIDIPLKQGAPIYAVSDGSIVLVKPAGDQWGGQGVSQLLQATGKGDGWAFIYEHITPSANIKNGSNIKTGDLIGTKTPPTGFTAHFQLSYIFNNYEFTRGMECWINYLDQPSVDEIRTWWNHYRKLNHLINSWRTTSENGQFPFRGLLDSKKFPDGLQLCYPPGTDVR